jgi:hypothetical protein
MTSWIFAPRLPREQFTLSSPNIFDGLIAQAQYGASGNVSPALGRVGALNGTKGS